MILIHSAELNGQPPFEHVVAQLRHHEVVAFSGTVGRPDGGTVAAVVGVDVPGVVQRRGDWPAWGGGRETNAPW